jgi:hypothetical protein
MRVARLSHDLVAFRSPFAAQKLRLGQVLRVGSGRAAVLCARGGILVGKLLPDRPGGALPTFGDGAMAEILPGELLHAPLGSGALLGGSVVDYLGGLLDGSVAAPVPNVPVFGEPPGQAALRQIDRSLHTGTLAIDALTPMGCGQSAIIFGDGGTGKSTIGWDACLAQATSDVHCVLALSDGGVERGRDALEELRRRGDDALRARTTVVTAGGSASAAERLLTLAAATAVAEAVRDGGGHALVVADDLNGLCDLWDAAGDAVAYLGGPAAGAAADRAHSSEQRIFYAAWLQRASQMADPQPSDLQSDVCSGSLSGGSITILGLMRQPKRPTTTTATTALAAADATAPTYTLEDFADRPAAQRARVEVLLARGIDLNDAVLSKLGIESPQAGSETGSQARLSGTEVTSSSAGPTPAVDQLSAEQMREAIRRGVSHADQLTSLADGHILLLEELFAAGRRCSSCKRSMCSRLGG